MLYTRYRRDAVCATLGGLDAVHGSAARVTQDGVEQTVAGEPELHSCEGGESAKEARARSGPGVSLYLKTAQELGGCLLINISLQSCDGNTRVPLPLVAIRSHTTRELARCMQVGMHEDA